VAGGASALDPLPPFKWSHSVCTFPSPPSNLQGFALTNGLIHRTRPSTLASGSPPPSYQTFPSRASSPLNVPNCNPPPYSPRTARPVPPIPRPPNRPPNQPFNRPPNRPPGIQPPFQPPVQPPVQPLIQPPFQPSRPTSYHHSDVPFRAETSSKIGYRPAICFTILLLLLEAVLISRSDSLAKFISLESTARRASWERSSLVTEREKSEREREKMKHDRKLWEKPLEERVPQGAFWEVVWPAWECRAYGKREYWGTLRDVPEGWSALDACMNMPVEIKGVTVRCPDRCAFVEGSPHIHGYWMVDWEQTDCKPRYQDFQDAVSQISYPLPHLYVSLTLTSQGCTSYRSGTRRIEAQIVGILNRKEQDWWPMCASTPLVWNDITYTSPTHCEERVSGFPFERFYGELTLAQRWGRKVAMWDTPDESCL